MTPAGGIRASQGTFSSLFCLFCYVLAHFVLVLQVGVKNIGNHNNHVVN